MPRTSPIAGGKIEKATLIHQPSNPSKDIEFLFNPTELSFSRSIRVNEEGGARTEKGYPKISFAYPEPRSLTISNLILDTSETEESVMPDLQKILAALEFATSGDAKGKRPPIYVFAWGTQNYMRCFVESVAYRLTLFLQDGTPVRAQADLTLKEVDGAIVGKRTAAQPNRQQSSRW
ncbi:MAG: hypothetical protein AAFY11_13685 [Cyanobacteria bacterium J06641_5]